LHRSVGYLERRPPLPHNTYSYELISSNFLKSKQTEAISKWDLSPSRVQRPHKQRNNPPAAFEKNSLKKRIKKNKSFVIKSFMKTNNESLKK